MKLTGKVVSGVGNFKERMTKYPEAFKKAAGEALRPGTINMDVGQVIPIQEKSRIKGTEIGEPNQDLLFEPCTINGYAAHRIRPFDINTGGGGHGDHILEIACSKELPDVGYGATVQIEFFRDK